MRVLNVILETRLVARRVDSITFEATAECGPHKVTRTATATLEEVREIGWLKRPTMAHVQSLAEHRAMTAAGREAQDLALREEGSAPCA